MESPVVGKLKSGAAALRRRLTSLSGSPRDIAMGFAMGLFVGMSPFFGMHIAISLVFATFLRCSRVAAAIGVNITNAFTAPLIYPITYWAGAKLTGGPIQWPESIDIAGFVPLLQQAPTIILQLCLGGAVLGVPIALFGYCLVLNTARSCRRKDESPKMKVDI